MFGWLLAVVMMAWASESAAAKDAKFVVLAMVGAALASEAVVSLINTIWDVLDERSRQRRLSPPQPAR